MPTPLFTRSAGAPGTARSAGWQAGLVGVLALGFFSMGLADGPFVDEYAYITQSYQPDLLVAGRGNDPSWLDVLCYDLVPLPKYLINGVYRLAGITRPRPRDALSWYENSHYRWRSFQELLVARLPSIPLAALGCVAIFCMGTMIRHPLTGWIAAVLLAINPLYRLHAHRAMSEAPCEATGLVALTLGLWAWKRLFAGQTKVVQAGVLMLIAGFFAGLAILSKFNGILVLMTLAGWTALGLALPSIATRGKTTLLVTSALACLIAASTFIVLNPFMTAHPSGPLPPGLQKLASFNMWERFQHLMRHRFEVSKDQQRHFSHNALLTPMDRTAVLIVQGFGRFGPFGPSKSDSEQRFDLAQDWGVLIWLPIAISSWAMSWFRGFRQFQAGEAPLCWLIVIWATLAVVVVGAYLPMAWDRYQLPIQAPVALLVALVLTGLAEWTRRPLQSTLART